jgi:hypothetical protein
LKLFITESEFEIETCKLGWGFEVICAKSAVLVISLPFSSTVHSIIPFIAFLIDSSLKSASILDWPVANYVFVFNYPE